jgi:hypothetical protein
VAAEQLPAHGLFTSLEDFRQRTGWGGASEDACIVGIDPSVIEIISAVAIDTDAERPRRGDRTWCVSHIFSGDGTKAALMNPGEENRALAKRVMTKSRAPTPNSVLPELQTFPTPTEKMLRESELVRYVWGKRVERQTKELARIMRRPADVYKGEARQGSGPVGASALANQSHHPRAGARRR